MSEPKLMNDETFNKNSISDLLKSNRVITLVFVIILISLLLIMSLGAIEINNGQKCINRTDGNEYINYLESVNSDNVDVSFKTLNYDGINLPKETTEYNFSFIYQFKPNNNLNDVVNTEFYPKIKKQTTDLVNIPVLSLNRYVVSIFGNQYKWIDLNVKNPDKPILFNVSMKNDNGKIKTVLNLTDYSKNDIIEYTTDSVWEPEKWEARIINGNDRVFQFFNSILGEQKMNTKEDYRFKLKWGLFGAGALLMLSLLMICIPFYQKGYGKKGFDIFFFTGFIIGASLLASSISVFDKKMYTEKEKRKPFMISGGVLMGFGLLFYLLFIFSYLGFKHISSSSNVYIPMAVFSFISIVVGSGLLLLLVNPKIMESNEVPSEFNSEWDSVFVPLPPPPTCSMGLCENVSKTELTELKSLQLISTNEPTKQNCKNTVVGMKNYLEKICSKDECKCLPGMEITCTNIDASILNSNAVCDAMP